MVPEDDYLRLEPSDGGHRTVWRIALMALLGCLLLLAALVLQAGATPPARGRPAPPAGLEHQHMQPAPDLNLVTIQPLTRPVPAHAALSR